MKKSRVLFIQPLLPAYSIDFFNEIISQAPELELTVAADLMSESPLNQLDQREVRFNTVNLEFASFGPFQWIKNLKAVAGSEKYDIVVFNGNPRDVSQLLVMCLMRIQKRTFYVWGMFHKIGRQKWHTRLYYQLVSKLAKKLLTYSRTGARNLASLGVPEQKISVIGTAIDQRRIREYALQVSENDKERFLEEQGLVGKKIVLQVVRLSTIKKPEFLIEAAKEILKERDDIVFILIGDGEMRAELELKSKDYNI
jgi:glycosyltransferase involved in cell wall biosynthesis